MATKNVARRFCDSYDVTDSLDVDGVVRRSAAEYVILSGQDVCLTEDEELSVSRQFGCDMRQLQIIVLHLAFASSLHELLRQTWIQYK